MPPKLKSGTNKRTTTASRSIPSTSDEVCSLCCRAIVDGKDDALLCEGVQSCNRWMHRYCAGVSVEHYESLDQSPLPFNCSLCIQRKQAAIIDELKSTIAALTAEVAELRSAVSVQQLENNDQSKWSDVVARRPRRPRIATRSQNRTTNENSRVLGAGTGPNTVAAGKVNQPPDTPDKVERVTVHGVRRVWGTKKDASTTVVLQTIRQLTKIDPEKRLTVKRKFRDGESGRRDRWWFLIRGSEAALGELESLWSCVSLQVGWKLEMCTKPSNDESKEANGNVHANHNNEESIDALNGSSNSPAPTNASNPETSGATRSDQPNNKQTGNVVVNNSNSSQSDSHSSHHSSAASPDKGVFLDK